MPVEHLLIHHLR